MKTDNDKASMIPFGLLELDREGTVVHYCPAREADVSVSLTDKIIGKNFFDEIVPIAPIKEFKNRFIRFMAFGDSVQRFTIRFPFEQRDVRVQIMLARITERTERGSERLALVRLMPETSLAFTEHAA